MYLAQSIEEKNRSQSGYPQRGATLLVYRVELDSQGRPVWKMHRDGGTWWTGYVDDENIFRLMRSRARKSANKAIPFMQDAGPGKLVTMKQAETLTGLHRPAALDKLTETVSDSPALQNYVKPKPVKPARAEPEPAAPPTKLQLAQTKLDRAQAKFDEWTRAIAHATEKRNEWLRKVRQRRRRVAALEGSAAAAQ